MPDIFDPSSDARRFIEALADQYGIDSAELCPDTLRILQRRLRESGWNPNFGVNKRSVVIISASAELIPAGVVIIAGTNWLRFSLINLSDDTHIDSIDIINPLIRFGSDPISRIAYGQSKGGGFDEMTALLRSTLQTAIGAMLDQAGLSPDAVVDGVIVADPVMHHILLGLDPSELGRAPYTPCFEEALDIRARDIGLIWASGALVHVVPLIGGHVGSDTIAAAVGAGLGSDDRTTLLVDIGTTTKIMVASKGRIMAAAPPAGSALDGVLLEAGRHVVPGAIETFRIDPVTFEPRFKVVGSPYWSDDPAFPGSAEALDLGGFCRTGLIDALAELRLSGLMGRDGTLDAEKAAVTSRIREEYRSSTYLVRESEPRIAITQHDIRALQMAKGAVQAAVRVLLKRLGAAGLDRVVLTCGSNVSIDPLRAAIIGLFPDCDPDAVEFVADAKLKGACSALVSRSAREAMARLARQTEVIETALDPDFQAQQIACTGFPHRSEFFPLLASRVTLDDAGPHAGSRREGRRRRG